MKNTVRTDLGSDRRPAIIFDLDGTLADTAPGVWHCVQQVLIRHCLPPLPDSLRQSFMSCSPLTRAFTCYCGVSGSNAAAMALTFSACYAEEGVTMASIYQGIPDLLQELAASGCSLGIATYKFQPNAMRMLAMMGLAGYFSAISGYSHGANNKSDIIRDCINALKVLPSQCIMVGDSETDLQASMEVGCRFVAVTYGYGFTAADTEPAILHAARDTAELRRQLHSMLCHTTAV